MCTRGMNSPVTSVFSPPSPFQHCSSYCFDQHRTVSILRCEPCIRTSWFPYYADSYIRKTLFMWQITLVSFIGTLYQDQVGNVTESWFESSSFFCSQMTSCSFTGTFRMCRHLRELRLVSCSQHVFIYQTSSGANGKINSTDKQPLCPRCVTAGPHRHSGVLWRNPCQGKIQPQPNVSAFGCRRQAVVQVAVEVE